MSRVIVKVPESTQQRWGYTKDQYWGSDLDLDVSWRLRDCLQRAARIKKRLRKAG